MRDYQMRHRALARNVLVVACIMHSQDGEPREWAAYCDAVPGDNHEEEQGAVADHGQKLVEHLARAIFPLLADVPYRG
jgi:hypothetical protein